MVKKIITNKLVYLGPYQFNSNLISMYITLIILLYFPCDITLGQTLLDKILKYYSIGKPKSQLFVV